MGVPRPLAASLSCFAAVIPLLAGQGLSPAELLKDPAVKAAIEASRAGEAHAIDEQIRLCEVPAPPFKETLRGEMVRQGFVQAGLRNVRVDRVGNVLGERPGAVGRPNVVLAAHLDTVFPEGTDVKVKREGSLLRGPGIGDDCRGLAVLLAVARALNQSGVHAPGTMTFVATVGEEGLGDLRGVKELFGLTPRAQPAAPAPSPLTIDRFLALDGTGLGITNVGVGSLRYRVTFKGPGGHSFAAFGLPNPIDALGRAVNKVADFQVPRDTGTTFNVGRIGGGTSVNAIPAEAWFEMDMRSTAPALLASLEARFLAAVDAAVTEENERWKRPRTITVVKERVGVRPAASTPMTSTIVRTADAVNQTLGIPTSFHESSTDANVPMSLEIPAITIGPGGRGADAHSLTESFDTADSWRGTERALLLMIALAHE